MGGCGQVLRKHKGENCAQSNETPAGGHTGAHPKVACPQLQQGCLRQLGLVQAFFSSVSQPVNTCMMCSRNSGWTQGAGRPDHSVFLPSSWHSFVAVLLCRHQTGCQHRQSYADSMVVSLGRGSQPNLIGIVSRCTYSCSAY